MSKIPPCRLPAHRKPLQFKNHLLRTYGLTIEDFDQMVRLQQGLCAMCGKQPKRFVVDHNHQTEIVRGLLCDKCNVGLSYIEDNVFLKQAHDYLGS